MRTADFDYDLPEELIAQEPSQVRGEDRMLVLDPATSEVTVGMFESLPDYLRPGDAIVLNNTRVIPARMFARKEPTGAEVELFYLNPDSEHNPYCLRYSNSNRENAHRAATDKIRQQVIGKPVIEELQKATQLGFPAKRKQLHIAGTIKIPVQTKLHFMA